MLLTCFFGHALSDVYVFCTYRAVVLQAFVVRGTTYSLQPVSNASMVAENRSGAPPSLPSVIAACRCARVVDEHAAVLSNKAGLMGYWTTRKREGSGVASDHDDDVGLRVPEPSRPQLVARLCLPDACGVRCGTRLC